MQNEILPKKSYLNHKNLYFLANSAQTVVHLLKHNYHLAVKYGINTVS